MNNKVIGAIVVVVLIGLIAYFAWGKKDNSNSVESTTQSTDTTQPAEQSTVSPQSLKDLLASGTAQKCTFSDSGSQGTFYVSSGKARGDFSSTSEGKVMTTHMIMDGQTTYFWTEGSTQGFKTMVAAGTAAAAPPTGQNQGVDPNKKVDYSCSGWSADSSMLVPPASVQFTDLGSFKAPTGY